MNGIICLLQVLTRLEGDWVKLCVLIVDMIASTGLTIISLTKGSKNSNESGLYPNESDENIPFPNGTNSTVTWTGQAIATVVWFVILGVFYITITTCYYIKKLWSEIKEAGSHDCSEILTENVRGFITAFGGFFYYLGDNISRITEYEICTGECAETVRIVGVLMLGTATVTYLPLLIDALFPHQTMLTSNTGKPAGLVVYLLLAKITNLDLIYTAIERAASKTCNNKVLGSAWAYYALYMFFFFWISVYELWTSEKEKAAEESKTCRCIRVIVIAILIFAFAASFILADTRLPLACTGKARDPLTQDIVRISLWGFTAIVGLLLW